MGSFCCRDLICPSTGLCVPPRDFCLEINVYEHMLKWHEHLLKRCEHLLINLLIKVQRFSKTDHFGIVSGLAEWAANFAGKYLIAVSTYAVTKERTVH